MQRWQRDGQLPTEFDEDVLFAFRALFEKSNQPQNYVSLLREYYLVCLDFRLVEGLPESMVGHSATKVYHFLQSIDTVLQEVRNEAAADSVLERLANVRGRAESPIDRRALDLLELLIERRAAEVLNQPGPHVQAGLTAMQRAFDREWSDGELRVG